MTTPLATQQQPVLSLLAYVKEKSVERSRVKTIRKCHNRPAVLSRDAICWPARAIISFHKFGDHNITTRQQMAVWCVGVYGAVEPGKKVVYKKLYFKTTDQQLCKKNIYNQYQQWLSDSDCKLSIENVFFFIFIFWCLNIRIQVMCYHFVLLHFSLTT